MSKLLLDTNILNHALKGQPQVLARLTESIQAGRHLLLAGIAHFEGLGLALEDWTALSGRQSG